MMPCKMWTTRGRALDMNTGTVLAVLSALLTLLLACSIPAACASTTTHNLTHRCSCNVTVGKTGLHHTLGDVSTYRSWQSTNCRHLRKQCRHDCDRAIRKYTLDNDDGYGFQLCARYGSVTPPGGLLLESVSRAGVCALGNRKGAWRGRLCCGHTPVTLDGHGVIVFGWDPKCDARRYVLAQPKHGIQP